MLLVRMVEMIDLVVDVDYMVISVKLVSFSCIGQTFLRIVLTL